MKKRRKNLNLPITFRRWSNKGYAVFSSLKQSIKIGCLMVAYLLFANPETISAQSNNDAATKNYDLEAIDVNSEQLPETYSSISRVVVTVTKAEIERAAITSVTDLIEYAANIDIRQRGAEGMQADISIRGGSFDQVLVLLNGVNISDPQTGHHQLNLPVEISSVERIEILKGPGAWKFGHGAFSGAINIITQKIDNSHLSAQLEFGQYNLNKQSLSAGIKLKQSSHVLSANRSATDGYTKNTDHLATNIFYQGEISALKGNFSVQAGATNKAFGANSFYSAKYPNQFEEVQTYFASANYSAKFKNVQISPRIYYRRNNDRFLLFRDNPPAYSNYHTTDVYGANFLANLFHGTKATTSVGADFRNETIFSNNLGEITATPITSPVNDTILLNRFHTRNNYSAFVGHKRYFKNLMVNIGVNLTLNSDLPSKLFLYPGIDMNYEISGNSSVFASANKTMRMPTYTDLFYTSPTNEGNAALLPEEAIGYELGYSFKEKFASASLTGFFIQGNNLIDWVKAKPEDKWKTTNYTSLNSYGVEVSSLIKLSNIFKEQKVVKDLKLNYTYIAQDKAETGMISNYALNYLKNRFDAELVVDIWKNIGASVHFAYQDRAGEYIRYENSAPVGLTPYQPFTTTDMKLFWIQDGWNIYASVNNAFGTTYYDYGNVPQPGRWIKVGVSKKVVFR